MDRLSRCDPDGLDTVSGAEERKMTDQELLAAYADGRDVKSLSIFVERYQYRLVRFASRMLSNGPAAQDVVQEAFLRVARHPKRLLGVACCHNWLMRAVRETCLDRLRRAIRRRRVLGELDREPVAVREPPGAPVAVDGTRKRVQRAIAELGPRDRELLLLKVLEGKSYREITEITGLTTTHVGHLLHHAMKALAHKLDGREGEV